jgi:hypothetical protein
MLASCPAAPDIPDQRLHEKVAAHGFDDDNVHDEAARVVAVAGDALRAAGYDNDLPLLEAMLAEHRTPAHLMREHFTRTGSFFGPAVVSSVGPAMTGSRTKLTIT